MDETQLVHKEFVKNGLTLATAESCTSGLLAARLTESAGSSAFYLGGVNSYANSAKIALLGVSPETLQSKGAVSKDVALQMSNGVRVRLDADIGIGITGVAGPSGGTMEKPVGTVWIAVTSRHENDDSTDVESFLFSGNREEVRRQSVDMAVGKLLKMARSVGQKGRNK